MYHTCFIFLLICMDGALSAYTWQQLGHMLTYECHVDGSVVLKGVPSDLGVTADRACDIYNTDANEYTLERNCREVASSNPYWYRTTRYWYRTTNYWDQTTVYPYSYTADYYSGGRQPFDEVIIMLSHGGVSGIIGGRDNFEFKLICDDLHSGGKMFRVSDNIYVETRPHNGIPTLSYRRLQKQKKVSYNHYPSMRITDSNGRDKQYGIHVGDLLYVVVSSNDARYAIRPENCSANAYTYYGYTSHKDVVLWNVRAKGCVLQPYLMEAFTALDKSQHSVRAPLYAFHFPGYYGEHTTVTCNVRICPHGSSDCDMSVCHAAKRSARDVEDEELDPETHHDVVSIALKRGNTASKAAMGMVTILISLCSLLFLTT